MRTKHQSEEQSRDASEDYPELNRVQKFKSFVYTAVRWVEYAGEPALEVEVEARSNGRALCSICGEARPGYDRLALRRFEFVPL